MMNSRYVQCFFFFFKQKTAYEIMPSLVGSEMCIRDRWEQMAFEGNPQFGVQLQPIDFAAFARACGAGGFTIEKPEEVESVLREALAYDGPAVVQAAVDPNEPPLPGNITMKQALKFAEALLHGEKDRWEIIKTVVEDKI